MIKIITVTSYGKVHIMLLWRILYRMDLHFIHVPPPSPPQTQTIGLWHCFVIRGFLSPEQLDALILSP
jgi:hypothetical protein